MTAKNTCPAETDSVDSVSEPENQPLTRNTYKKAVDRLLVKLTNSVEADSIHPYLEDHEVGAHDLSVDQFGNLLAVAVDIKASFKENAYIPCPQNLLTIEPTGEYRLEAGAKFTGCAVMIGHKRLRQIARDRLARHEIFITVDFATGAFLHEETGSPAVVAIKTCNTVKVHEILKSLFPNAYIVTCLNFESNKHRMRKKMIKAISESGGIAIVPRFTLKERFNGLISFNDQAMFHQDRDQVIENILNLLQYDQDFRQDRFAEEEVKTAAESRNDSLGTGNENDNFKIPQNKHRKKPIPRKPSACHQEVSL